MISTVVRNKEKLTDNGGFYYVILHIFVLKRKYFTGNVFFKKVKYMNQIHLKYMYMINMWNM